jgi:Ca-activated chloride channel family protein
MALWLLVVVPVVWLARPFSRTRFNPRQQWLQAAIRSAILVALALAVARPVIATGSSRLSVVYLVDVSYSVSSRAVADAATTIDRLNGAVRPAHTRIVAFGTDAAVLETTAALRHLAETDPSSTEPRVVDQQGTDLDLALRAARAELAPGHVPRIVLFSDGRPTAGDVREAVARLAADGVPVHVSPLAAPDLGDTWIDGIEVPERIAAGSAFRVSVAIGSQRAVAVQLDLRSAGRVIASRTVPLSVGATTVTLDAVLDRPGAQTIEAAVTVPADPLPVNNQLTRAVWVDPRARVLYVEGTPASATYLAGALSQSGFDVSVQPPSALPTHVDGLDLYDVVVLSDVARAAIPDAAMTAVSGWVEQEGGGLLVAGGEAVFGEGGYRKTELERLTPVTFERRDEPAIALIIVLDKSYSMSGQQIELCKAAAQAAIDALGDEQSVGVITFNDQLNWDVTLRNVGKNRAAIRKAVSAIEASGHTLIYPAIEQAYLALKNTKARAKHVVLLSDGRSVPDEYERLVTTMANERMTVSTIAVGPAADTELLGNIATWGRGRSYVEPDATQVPQIFVKEAKNIPTPAFDEQTIRPVVKNLAFLEGLDLAHMPSLRGRTATVLKDTALEVLATGDNDPLLAFWPIGLGRTAVFASDVKDRWAADWIRWRGYGPFFTAVVRALTRQHPAELALEVTPGPRHGQTRQLAIAVEARDTAGTARNLLKPQVQIRGADGGVTDVAARQVAPGRYEAGVLVNASEPVSVEVVGAPAGVTSQLIVPDPPEEYRFRPPDETLLKSIAAATGGTWMPTASALANTALDHQTERRPLWPALLAGALGLWFVDIAMRRFRVFEPRTPAA